MIVRVTGCTTVTGTCSLCDTGADPDEDDGPEDDEAEDDDGDEEDVPDVPLEAVCEDLASDFLLFDFDPFLPAPVVAVVGGDGIVNVGPKLVVLA